MCIRDRCRLTPTPASRPPIASRSGRRRRPSRRCGTWSEWPDGGEPLDAVVVLRRTEVADEAGVEALEEEAMAEAIAAWRGEQPGEGTVDVAVYTQVNPCLLYTSRCV